MTDFAGSPRDPLTETTYLILLSLVPDPRHGYSIMKEVAALSENQVQLSTGTLYGALNRLLEQEWIERIDTDNTTRSRKDYRLTGLGQAILNREVARLKNLVALARLRKVEG